MCLGTVGQITGVGPEGCVQITACGRQMAGSLLAVSDAVGLGDWVVLHSGLVLARLTEHEAMDALQLRRQGAQEPSERGAI
jgi:hydrogenase maturation factor